MKPALRTQVDDLAEIYSLETNIDCSNLPDLTRQEFKDETDVNKTIARFRGGDQPMRQVQYGEMDYDMDLQQSLAAINAAQAAARKLPKPLRDKYYQWETLMGGMRSGEFKKDLDTYLADEQKKKDLTKEKEPTIVKEPSKE